MNFLCREVGAGFSQHGDKSAGFDPRNDLRFIWTADMNIIGSNGWTLEDQETLVEMVRVGKLKPAIDRVMPLDQGIEACRMLEERRFLGKIMVKPRDKLKKGVDG